MMRGKREEGIILFSALLFILVAPSPVAAWSNLDGGDHGGADWIITTNTTIADNHYNIGLFKIAAGVTVTVQPYNGTSYGWVEIHAENIIIEGVLSANAAGYRNAEGPGAGVSISYSHLGGAGGSAYGSSTNSVVEMGSGGGNSIRATGGVAVGGGGGGGYGGGGGDGADAATDASFGDGGATAVGGRGGGKIVLVCEDNMSIFGMISAKGGDGQNGPYHTGGGGGGAGGGIILRGSNIHISGTVSAAGGRGGRTYPQVLGGGPCGSGGGGGGGRIKIFSDVLEISGTLDVAGGLGGGYGVDYECVGSNGNSGTTYICGAPFLFEPENNSLKTSRLVQFSWSNTYAENYRLLIARDISFTQIVENITLSGTSYTAALPEGDLYWKVIAVRSYGENSSQVFLLKHYFPPTILSILCDNTLVDRKTNFPWAVAGTKITVTVQDNGGEKAVVCENVKFSLRDAAGNLVIENLPAEGYETVNENTRRFYFTYNPNDALPDSSLGLFDVSVLVLDNYEMNDNENFDGMGRALFVVNDLKVDLSLADNTPIWRLEVSGNAFRVYENHLTTLDNVIIVDNNEGELQADFTDNAYSATYGLVSPARLHQGDSGEIYARARDNVLDGISLTLPYLVEGDNLYLLNYFVMRYENRTEITFEAKWTSDGGTAVNGTVYLPENQEITGSIFDGSGQITLLHSAKIKSGNNKRLSVFDTANRPIHRVVSQTFSFNILPVATNLRVDGKDCPAIVSQTPTFSWSFEDNNPNDSQLGVRIQIGSTPDNNDVWDWLDAAYALQTKMYDGPPLPPGTYYFRIIVRDSQLEWQNTDNPGNWSRGIFQVAVWGPVVEPWTATITTTARWQLPYAQQMGESTGGMDGGHMPSSDATPPTFEVLEPTSEKVGENVIIQVKIKDPSGIDAGSITVKLDNSLAAHRLHGDILTITLTKLAPGGHWIEIRVKDASPMRNDNGLLLHLFVAHPEENVTTEDFGSQEVPEILGVSAELLDGVITENLVRVREASLSTMPRADNVVCYSCFELVVVGEKSPAAVTVQFRVAREWIREKGLSPFAVRLYHVRDNQLEELNTVVSGGDSSYLFYSSRVTSSSKFLIGGRTIYPMISVSQRISVSSGIARVLVNVKNPTEVAFSHTLQLRIGTEMAMFTVNVAAGEEESIEVIMPANDFSEGTYMAELFDASTGTLLNSRMVEIVLAEDIQASSGGFQQMLLAAALASGGIGAGLLFYVRGKQKRAVKKIQPAKVFLPRSEAIEASPLMRDYCELLLPLAKHPKKRLKSGRSSSRYKKYRAPWLLGT